MHIKASERGLAESRREWLPETEGDGRLYMLYSCGEIPKEGGRLTWVLPGLLVAVLSVSPSHARAHQSCTGDLGQENKDI